MSPPAGEIIVRFAGGPGAVFYSLTPPFLFVFAPHPHPPCSIAGFFLPRQGAVVEYHTVVVVHPLFHLILVAPPPPPPQPPPPKVWGGGGIINTPTRPPCSFRDCFFILFHSALPHLSGLFTLSCTIALTSYPPIFNLIRCWFSELFFPLFFFFLCVPAGSPRIPVLALVPKNFSSSPIPLLFPGDVVF